MEEKEFIDNFTAQLDETAPELVDITTRFKELEEWSSLTALSLIAMADESYGVTLTGEDIQQSSTVADLLRVIKSKQ
jgi:acyl carrier protein